MNALQAIKVSNYKQIVNYLVCFIFPVDGTVSTVGSCS